MVRGQITWLVSLSLMLSGCTLAPTTQTSDTEPAASPRVTVSAEPITPVETAPATQSATVSKTAEPVQNPEPQNRFEYLLSALKIEGEYNATDSIASIRATVVYTSKVDFPHNISIVVVEDSIIDKQEYPSTHPVHPGYDKAYVFTNIFRGMVTNAPFGDPLLPTITAKEPGRALVKNFKYKLTNVLNPAKCRVIAFINSTKTGDLQIIQSAQVKLK